MPYFTIIIPTFNAESTLKSCLKSIINQTFEDFQVIIQDAVSKDDTLYIAESFNDKRIQVLQEKDRGVYDAMNKAIDKATGQWLYFLGSDDRLYDSNVLLRIRDFLEVSKTKIVYGNVQIKGESGWAKNEDTYRGEITLQDLLEHNYPHQATFYHRSLFADGLRYNLDYPICSDYDLNLLLTSREKVTHMDITVAVFAAGGLSTHEIDTVFLEEKWRNIVRYFYSDLKSPVFKPYQSLLKKEGFRSIRRWNIQLGIRLLMVYLRHKYFGEK